MELVKYIDGDGRPHQIESVAWNPGMGKPNDGWWEYRFVDNRIGQESELVPFIDEILLERITDWLVYQIDEDRKLSYNMIDELREYFLKP